MLIRGVSAIIYFMKITKLTVCLLFLTVLFLTPSCKDGYDDSELTGRVENLENRVQKLEEQMNSNISSLQAILKALDNNDYITGVTPIMEGDKEIGYTISFKKENPITIYHGQNGQNGQDGKPGEDGQDGYTPQIGVKQDTDGIYYWTLDGEWMTDESGNKIKAQGIDGQNGQDGMPGENGQDGKPGQDGQNGQDGITPQFKIENEYWWVSYDDGATWKKLGQATGSDATSIFKSVTKNDKEVIFTLNDDTTIVIPIAQKIEISFDYDGNEIGISEGKTLYIDYYLKNASEDVLVTASSDGNFVTKVESNGKTGGRISVKCINGGTDGYINVIVNDGNGYSYLKVINIYKNKIDFVDGLDYKISALGGNVIVPISVNFEYDVTVVEGNSWVSIKPESRVAMRDEVLVFSVDQNTTSAERYAKIHIHNPADSREIYAEVTIGQSKVLYDDTDAIILVTHVNFVNNLTAYLPKLSGSNITIDWGDGNKESYDNVYEKSYVHKYYAAAPTDFDIKITGDIQSLSSYDIKGYTIKGIKQWGTSKLKNMKCAFYEQPLEYIAEDKYGALQDVTNFDQAFFNCPSLANIPEGLFDYCTNVTSFVATFCGCTSLTTLPKGLFDNCTKVTSFIETFCGCSSLTSIPEGLFDNCTNVTNFGITFQECSSLTTLPKGLFDDCINVTSFVATFTGCTSLSSIPEGLFDYCTNVTSFNSTFSECSSLSSIPEGLFDNCTKVKSFERTFYYCTSLTTLPQGLFDDCINVTSFEDAFYCCRSLTTLPQGLFDDCINVTSFNSTFSGCKSLISIPEGLFDDCTNVADFNSVFSSCNQLTFIPQGLFDNCIKVTSFVSTFSGCSSLVSIPEGLFDNNRMVQDFRYTFGGCKNLTGESPYTIINGVKYHLYERSNNPEQFISPTKYSLCFSECSMLTDKDAIPSGWK